MNSRREILLGAGAAALGLAGLHSVAAATPEAGRRRHTRASKIPNVPLRTHDGRTVYFYDDLLRGKVAVFNMMYSACERICPGMTANLRRVQNLLGERAGHSVFMYSITLQPEQDTPRVLDDYARNHRVKPGWLFLTGKRTDVERLRFGLGFYDLDPTVDKDKATHTGMLRIGNEPYDRWVMAPALADPGQILAAINHVDRSMYKERRV